MPAYNYYNDPYVYGTQPAQMSQYQQVYKPQQPPNPINNYGMIWAQGEQAAKAYPTAPSTSIILWDPDVDVFYKKTTDAQGKPILFEVYEYKKKEIQNESQPIPSQMYPSNQELESEIQALSNKIDNLVSSLSAQSSSKETQPMKLDKIPKRTKEVFVDAKSDV